MARSARPGKGVFALSRRRGAVSTGGERRERFWAKTGGAPALRGENGRGGRAAARRGVGTPWGAGSRSVRAPFPTKHGVALATRLSTFPSRRPPVRPQDRLRASPPPSLAWRLEAQRAWWLSEPAGRCGRGGRLVRTRRLPAEGSLPRASLSVEGQTEAPPAGCTATAPSGLRASQTWTSSHSPVRGSLRSPRVPCAHACPPALPPRTPTAHALRRSLSRSPPPSQEAGRGEGLGRRLAAGAQLPSPRPRHADPARADCACPLGILGPGVTLGHGGRSGQVLGCCPAGRRTLPTTGSPAGAGLAGASAPSFPGASLVRGSRLAGWVPAPVLAETRARSVPEALALQRTSRVLRSGPLCGSGAPSAGPVREVGVTQASGAQGLEVRDPPWVLASPRKELRCKAARSSRGKRARGRAGAAEGWLLHGRGSSSPQGEGDPTRPHS